MYYSILLFVGHTSDLKNKNLYELDKCSRWIETFIGLVLFLPLTECRRAGLFYGIICVKDHVIIIIILKVHTTFDHHIPLSCAFLY